MTFGDKVKGFADNMQDGVKVTSVSLLNIFLRLISGAFLGFTLALIGQEFAGYGTFSLIFCTIVVIGLFMRISRTWRIPHILVFDLICILVAQLLRMYILLAP
jgi:hypothetical protein